MKCSSCQGCLLATNSPLLTLTLITWPGLHEPSLSTVVIPPFRIVLFGGRLRVDPTLREVGGHREFFCAETCPSPQARMNSVPGSCQRGLCTRAGRRLCSHSASLMLLPALATGSPFRLALCPSTGPDVFWALPYFTVLIIKCSRLVSPLSQPQNSYFSEPWLPFLRTWTETAQC